MIQPYHSYLEYDAAKKVFEQLQFKWACDALTESDKFLYYQHLARLKVTDLKKIGGN